ncbi:MAG: hypothetical protein IIV29_07450, partial [Tidjanibacter sp.]|nr:hypothetical protein [Tidjanibacter sp.]
NGKLKIIVPRKSDRIEEIQGLRSARNRSLLMQMRISNASITQNLPFHSSTSSDSTTAKAIESRKFKACEAHCHLITPLRLDRTEGFQGLVVGWARSLLR